MRQTWKVIGWCLGLGMCLGMWVACAPKKVCTEGLSACEGLCVDFESDTHHCGACGNVCLEGQVCSEGACVCRLGKTTCNGACVDVRSNPQHCGTCGKTCEASSFCEDGTCVVACQKKTACDQACVDVQSDADHCGACESPCQDAESCRRGVCTLDVVAACFSNGQLVGLQAESLFRSPAVSVGAGPVSLTAQGDELWVLDGLEQRLYRRVLSSVKEKRLEPKGAFLRTGQVPNQAVAYAGFVFIANAGSGTLQVMAPEKDFATVAEVQLGENSYPEGVAFLGTHAFVPLYGGFGSESALAGQKVVELDVTQPASPKIFHTYDLTTLDLKPFAGQRTLPRPYAIVAHRNAIYVALNNLDATSYVPQGPGMLVRIDPATMSMSTLELPRDVCLNPIWMASSEGRLLVSCQGKVEYAASSSLQAVRVEGTGLVLLDEADEVASTWALRCPADDVSCRPALASRFAWVNNRVYLGDQNHGRVFVLSTEGNQLKELRGLAVKGALQVCAENVTTQVSNVSDVVASP